jgi:hypothetical protein
VLSGRRNGTLPRSNHTPNIARTPIPTPRKFTSSLSVRILSSLPSSSLTAPVYPDLKDFAPQLKVFYNKQLYAGSWDGIDVHGGARELMRMDLSAMPYKVREWMKRETKQKHYSVQDDNVFFAPGAIYPILPLWVDDADEAELECEDVFDDLENYANEPKDGAVVGKVTHSEAGKGEVQFTVEALLVKKKGKAPTRKEEL